MTRTIITTVAVAISLAGGAGASAQPRPPVTENPYGEAPEPPTPADEGGEQGAPADHEPTDDGEGASGAQGEEPAEGDEAPADRTPIWGEGTDEVASAGGAGSGTTAVDVGLGGPTESVAGPSETGAVGGSIPLSFDLHGYFRARAVWTGNVPIVRDAAAAAEAQDAGYVFQRLRLLPELRYGSDEDNPIVRLRMEIDALDNIVWGDNERLANTPLFAGDPSSTDFEGLDVDTIQLKRAWLEFLMPIGQIRIGRMPSQWGLGILTTGGDGLGEWGDPHFGTTYDRFLFATRPLTIVNALTTGDPRPTPLVFAVAYDKLVEDPLQDPAMDLDGDPADPETRATVPFDFLSNGSQDVQEVVMALLWKDPEVNPLRETDQLLGGLYYVHRWQTSTNSYVHILDAFANVRYALGPTLPSFTFETEIVTIQGISQGISLAGGCGPEVCNETDANIWGAVARAGVVDREARWAGKLELGYSSGDGQIFNDGELSARPLHPDYHVGMLLYQVAMLSSTSRLGEEIRPLWSRGGVWNSNYIYPQARYTLIPGVEVHGAFLLAWADELLNTVYVNERADFNDTGCSLFEGDCFIGWEADLALRLKWGENDLMWWDTEAGIMNAGSALHQDGVNFGLSEPLLWTVQTRVGMVF